MYHEDWYPNDQLAFLCTLYERVKLVGGLCIEIGIWEGKSTNALANVMNQRTLIAIDTWQGNTDESNDHNTVKLLKERDVKSAFYANMAAQNSNQNITVYEMDWREAFAQILQRGYLIAFLHIDGSHDYQSVFDTITYALPRMREGGVMCGDDFLASHAGRADLNGGVERAVRETLPGFQTSGNLWWWQKEIA